MFLYLRQIQVHQIDAFVVSLFEQILNELDVQCQNINGRQLGHCRTLKREQIRQTNVMQSYLLVFGFSRSANTLSLKEKEAEGYELIFNTLMKTSSYGEIDL